MKISKIFLAILLFFSLFNGCINQKHTGRLVYFEEFDVTFEELPVLNKPVDLVCTVTQMKHSSERFLKEDVVLEVELPEGFELVDGKLKWEGHLDANKTKTHTVTVKAVKTGKWTIRVWGGPSGSPKFELKNLYVTVTETSARISTKPIKKSMITDSNNHTGDLKYFKDFNISFSDLPILNYHTTLKCAVIQMKHSSERFFKEDVVLEVELPEGFELVDGKLKWEGYLDANKTKTHTVTVKAVKTGKWTIRVWGGPSGSPKFELKNLYVTVTETSAEVFTDPYFGQTEFTEEEIRALTEGKSTSDIDDRAQTDYEKEPGEEPEAQWIWVTGTVKALYGSDEIRIRYAKVELYDDDSGMEVLLATSLYQII